MADKKPEESWTGEFGKRLKQNLFDEDAHRKCKERFVSLKAEAPHMIVLQPEGTNANANNDSQQHSEHCHREFARCHAHRVAGEPLMSSDIPYPDEETVRAL